MTQQSVGKFRMVAAGSSTCVGLAIGAAMWGPLDWLALATTAVIIIPIGMAVEWIIMRPRGEA